MRELFVEIVLRLAKVVAAALLAAIVWAVAVGPAGATPSVELALLSFLAGSAIVLLVESSPF